MASSTNRVRPGRPPSAGDRYRQPVLRSYQTRPAPDLASEKRSQSKPLVLSPSASTRCSDFLEIEAIEAITLVFKCLRREKARFPRTKDRHAPGFIPKPRSKAGAWLCAANKPDVPSGAEGLRTRRVPERVPSEQSWNVLKNQGPEASGSYPKVRFNKRSDGSRRPGIGAVPHIGQAGKGCSWTDWKPTEGVR
jgi:hypothetical protein